MHACKLGLVLTATFIVACSPKQEPETPSGFSAFEHDPAADGPSAHEDPASAHQNPPSSQDDDPPSGQSPENSEEQASEASEIQPLGSPLESARPLGNAVEETRTTQVIADVVRRNRQAFRDCYDKELARSPGLRGKITLHFVLDPRGQVSLAEVNAERTTLTQPTLGKCALEALKKLQFPPSSRGFESTVNYPFDFKP